MVRSYPEAAAPVRLPAEERQQVKWLVSTMVAVIVVFVVSTLLIAGLGVTLAPTPVANRYAPLEGGVGTGGSL